MVIVSLRNAGTGLYKIPANAVENALRRSMLPDNSKKTKNFILSADITPGGV
ncbi:MAG: hypothetical protein ACJAYB_001560 [Psychromonas sp.]